MPKILLVEDNEMNRDMLSRRLEKRGYTLTLAVDGGQGVALAKSELPDLILMDMSLPVLDGWDATRQVKADPATKGIPVIVCTSKGQETDKIWGLRQGAVDYLVKPLNPEELLQRIAALP